jgi:hypothetical protein
MKRLIAALLLIAAPAMAQRPFTTRIYEVADLPTCTTAIQGRAFTVTDGSDASDCSSGGGSDVHWCVCGGSSWASSSGSAGDKIEEGNSNVEVIDTGTGQIDFDLDGSQVGQWDGTGLTVGVTDATDQLVLPSSNDVVTPTLAFGDGDTGFFEAGDDIVGFTRSGGSGIEIYFDSIGFGYESSRYPFIRSEESSTTNPTLNPSYVDADTGIGRSEITGTLSLINDGVLGLEIGTVALGANYLTVTPAAASSHPSLSASGSDTNVDIILTPKGTGGVAIGTTAASYDLHVAEGAGDGNVQIRAQCVDANCESYVAVENDAQAWHLGVNSSDNLQIRDITNTANPFIIETGASANSLYVEADGDVGMGVTNPSQKLQVDGNVLADNVRLNAYDYGELYENAGSPGTTITVTTAGTYYGWVSATAGDSNNITSDVADATADHLTIATAGTYYISIHVSFSGTATAVVECALFVNGTENEHIEIYRKLGTAGDVGSASAGGIEVLSASDELSVRCTSDGNNDDIDVWSMNLAVMGIG